MPVYVGSQEDVVIFVGFMWQAQVVMVWVTATLVLKAIQVQGGQLIKCEPINNTLALGREVKNGKANRV